MAELRVIHYATSPRYGPACGTRGETTAIVADVMCGNCRRIINGGRK